MFFYSPVNYVKRALDAMLVGVHARKLTFDHLPLPPIGVPDPVVLVGWKNAVYRPAMETFARWAKKARDEKFWDDVLYIQPGRP